MIAIALSGFAALALEVVWMRILIQSFCATVYAFSVMLSCFLFGIFYGSKWISRRVDRQSPCRVFSVSWNSAWGRAWLRLRSSLILYRLFSVGYFFIGLVSP